MASSPPTESRRPASEARGRPGFTEAAAWRVVGNGWRQLSGGFHKVGYSIEWHDFTTKQDLDWSASFHPDSVEICLNLSGQGEVRAGRRTLGFGAGTGGFYVQRGAGLAGCRRGGERHRFVTIELSLDFLAGRVSNGGRGLHPRMHRALIKGSRSAAEVSEPVRLTSEQEQIVMGLRRPPVYAAAQRLWYEAKALELAAAVLYQPLPGEEMFCQRVKRLNRERAQRVGGLLRENLAEPPSLEELGRRVGCSPFHLSRIFAEEMGKPMTVYLREVRLERAAELLRTGECNVTEAAFAVGYNSLSHFTVAFRETFGCCPGLYPLRAAARQCAPERERAG